MSSARDRCVADAHAICAIPAPTGEEARRGAWIAARLAESGLDPRRDALGDVTVRFGGDGPALVVAAHMDIVFAGVEEIEPRHDVATIHAPGIGDNSLGVAALIELARAAAELDWAGRRPLVLAATVGEEGLGNLRGVNAVLDATDCAELVAIEGGFQEQLIVGGVGSRRFEVTVSARGGHSWLDRGEPSAVHALVALLAGTVDGCPARSVNVGEIAGGTGVNVIAASASARVEFRDVAESRLAAAERRLRRAAHSAERLPRATARRDGDDALTVAIAELGVRPAGRTARRHPLVRDALRARRLAGLSQPELTTSSTDANAALGRGIPALTVGMATNHGPHTLAEHVDTTGLDRALAALKTLADLRTAPAAAPGQDARRR